MYNKRITFSLLYSKGYFHLSRNFRLQKVGDLNWLKENYRFNETCQYIDELIFILVTENPEKNEIKQFLESVNEARKKIFAPIILGGAIRNLSNVKSYFDNGADKIIINTKADDQKFLEQISNLYGSQAISIMLDYKIDKKEHAYDVYAECGKFRKKNDLFKTIKNLDQSHYGELILHSIDKDGTGDGHDLTLLKNLSSIKKPILLMGGAGKPEHIVNSLKNDLISGIVTANLFNFIGNGLKNTRELAISQNVNVAKLI
tara:strand:- start:618 stop:1394 length:777 start_codon:yes stop_codon:yes gene_type:complete